MKVATPIAESKKGLVPYFYFLFGVLRESIRFRCIGSRVDLFKRTGIMVVSEKTASIWLGHLSLSPSLVPCGAVHKAPGCRGISESDGSLGIVRLRGR